MQKRLIFAFLLLAYILTYFFGSLKLPNEIFANFIEPAMFLFLPILGSLLGIAVIRKYGLETKHGRSFLFLTLGNIFFLIGELLWYYHSLVLGTDPFPSLADVFYLFAYPLFFIGFILEIKIGKIKFDMRKTLGVILFVLILAPLFLYNFWKAILVSRHMDLGDLIANLYNIGDIILLLVCAFLFLMLLEYRKGKIFFCWIWILISFIFVLVADLIFADFVDAYESNAIIKSLIDSFWLAGYGLFAIGMMCFNSMLKEKRIEVLEKIKNKYEK